MIYPATICKYWIIKPPQMTPQQNKASILFYQFYDNAKGDNPHDKKHYAKQTLLKVIDGLLTNDEDRELIRQAAKKL